MSATDPEAERIDQIVTRIIATELRVDPSSVGMATRLRDELAADSLDALTIALHLEKTFGVKIPDDMLVRFVTPGDIVEGLKTALDDAENRGKVSPKDE